jgi:hypothetical protein
MWEALEDNLKVYGLRDLGVTGVVVSGGIERKRG